MKPYINFLNSFISMALGSLIAVLIFWPDAGKPCEKPHVAQQRKIVIEKDRLQREVIYLSPRLRLVLTVQPKYNIGTKKAEPEVTLDVERYAVYIYGPAEWYPFSKMTPEQLAEELSYVKGVTSPFADDKPEGK